MKLSSFVKTVQYSIVGTVSSVQRLDWIGRERERAQMAQEEYEYSSYCTVPLDIEGNVVLSNQGQKEEGSVRICCAVQIAHNNLYYSVCQFRSANVE